MKYYPIMSEIWLWMHFIDFIYHQGTKSGNQWYYVVPRTPPLKNKKDFN